VAIGYKSSRLSCILPGNLTCCGWRAFIVWRKIFHGSACGFTDRRVENINQHQPTETPGAAVNVTSCKCGKDVDMVNKESNISDSTFQRLRELIVHGKLAPGSRVIEADLADRLGVSRTPLRAARHRLQQEGYIVVTSLAGNKERLSVAPLTEEDARELYWIVGLLEGSAARLCCELEAKARTDLIAELNGLNEKLQQCALAKRAEANHIFDLDISFHQAIVDAGAGPRLRAIHAGIKPQTERYWRLYASAIIDRLDVSVNEHLAIMDSIEHSRADEAEKAIKLNWQNGADRLCQVIKNLGERGSW
jgi:DNA-binding GntR family transcriptional regulator